MVMEYKNFVVRFIKTLDNICEQEGTTVANKYHIDKGLVSNIRTGKRIPTPEFFKKHFGSDFPKHKIMIFIEED